MTVREYIGARYIPVFMGTWDSTSTYEPLSIVEYQGNSYTSRQYVPAGIEITNTAYWFVSGNYNAQIEQYRQEVSNINNQVETNTKNIATNTENIATNTKNIAANTEAIKNIEKRDYTNYRETFMKIPFGSIPYPTGYNSTTFNQGACIKIENGIKYLYAFCTNNTENISWVYKINLSNGVISEPKVLPSTLAHPNDVVWNETENLFIVASPQVNGSAVYYANLYDYNSNEVVNSFEMPTRCFNIAYNKNENVYYTLDDPNPWTGGTLYVLDYQFNVVKTISLQIEGGITPQSLVFNDNKLYLGYCTDNVTAGNDKHRTSDGEGIMVFNTDGTFVANIYGNANGELESISPYDDNSWLVGYHVNRYGSAFSSMQFFRVFISNPKENTYEIFTWNNANNNMQVNQNIYIDSSNTSFFSDGSVSHPLKRFSELTNMQQTNNWIYIYAKGTFENDTLFVRNARIKVDGNNETVFNGLMFFGECDYVDIRNIVINGVERSSSSIIQNAIISFNHCQYNFMRGVTINNTNAYDYCIEQFGGNLAGDSNTIGVGKTSAILCYAGEIYITPYVNTSISHMGSAPKKIFDYTIDGEWTPGNTKDIFGFNQYNVFYMFPAGGATPLFGVRGGNNIRFFGGYQTDGTYTSYGATITLSGITATLVNMQYITHTAGGSHGNKTVQNVGVIYAIC